MEEDMKELVFMSMILGGFLVLVSKFYHQLILKPKRIRQILQKQGIKGPSPSSFMYGNISEIKKINQRSRSADGTEFNSTDQISHAWPSSVFPHVLQWRNEYGPTFIYSTGQLQILCITDAEMVKEDMVSLMVASTMEMIQSWKSQMKNNEEYADVKVDEDLRSLSADMISRACFGSNYTQGETIFAKLRDLQKAMSKSTIGVPGSRYLPSKNNREIWRLEKEINTMILKVVKERTEGTSEKDLLQSILVAAECYGKNGDLPLKITPQKFIVDNCKSIYFAGHETTATSAAWCLVMLAANSDWQDRARAEVVEVCGGKVPNPDMLRKMKTLTMVIQETLRLYSPVAYMTRETLENISFKHICIPKGVNIQIVNSVLHQNPDLWSLAMESTSPAFRLTVEPGYGVHLLVKKV